MREKLTHCFGFGKKIARRPAGLASSYVYLLKKLNIPG
jgi:hypothetical protein